MKILELQAENFKKLRVVEIRPRDRVVQVTGKNGAGKTSTLDAIWFALKGKKALPMKAVRKGAERMKVVLKIGPSDAKEDLEFTVTRTLSADSETPTLDIKMIKGKRDTTPEAFLNSIFDELTYDPLGFVQMSASDQVAKLRETAKVDLDFEAIAAAQDEDYKLRAKANKEVDRLEIELAGAKVLEGLPAEKIDEAGIMARLNAAAETNRQAQEVFKAKQDLGAKAAQIGIEKIEIRRRITANEAEIDRLEKLIKSARQVVSQLEKDEAAAEIRQKHAEEAFQAAPAGELIDMATLTSELQDAQRTNRAIEERRIYDTRKAELEEKRREASTINARMSQREENRRLAVSNAKIPIDGLAFNDAMTQVMYKGLPLENLGEGEQIRISALIGMAANPKLRVLCVRHGEALDDDGLQVLTALAEEHDFQIWMARVDSSGQVGIVLEDGMVARRNGDQ
jgi:chromosome segregation ATPase